MDLGLTRKASSVVSDGVVLKYLFEHKIATSEQIRRDVLPSYTLGSVRNKLWKLQKRKYIAADSIHRLGRISCYYLTKRGYHLLGDVGFDKSRIKLKSECPLHDLKLVDLKFDLLSSTNVSRYFTCLLYTSPSPRDRTRSRMPSSA